MFLALIQHAWLNFRRAHYFKRKLGFKIIIGLVFLSMLRLVLSMSQMLPAYLGELFPGRDLHESFFSVLIFIFTSDLLIRIFGQKLSAHKIQPYLHLPVSRKKLALYSLIRSWFSLYNFYLLVLLIPVFPAILPEGSGIATYFSCYLGILLISGLNHSIVTLSYSLKVNGKLYLVLFIAATATATLLFPRFITDASRIAGLMIMNGSPLIFFILLSLITFLQWLSIKQTKSNYYNIQKTGDQNNMIKNDFGIILRRIPVFGAFWDLEWKLLKRNKRTRAQLAQWPVMIPLVMIVLYYFLDIKNLSSYYVALLMFSGSFGFFHLQYSFSWESHFFDLLSTRNFDLRKFVLAKYLFYVAMAMIQLIILIPAILLLKPEMFTIFLSLSLYSCGPVFAILLYFGVSNSTRMDPDKKAQFNFEGTSGSLFITVLLVFASLIPLAITGLFLPWGFRINMIVLTSVTGLLFIATSPFWTKAVAGKFVKSKYQKLAKFRE